MKRTLLLLTVSALGITASLVQASDTAGYSGIVRDAAGKPITDGAGECISYGKLKHFHHDDGSKYCGEKPAVKPAPAPVVAAPVPAPMPAPKPVVKPVVPKKVTLGASALFDNNKSELRSAGKKELDTLASQLKQMKKINSITVTGHTDSSGPEAYNQRLSEKRAQSVKDYLVTKGIDAGVIRTEGKGESSPVAPNNTREGRQQNRRVELSIDAEN